MIDHERGMDGESARARARRENAQRRRRRKGERADAVLRLESKDTVALDVHDNPFAAPADERASREPELPSHLPAATKGERLVHYVIDTLVLTVISWLVLFGLMPFLTLGMGEVVAIVAQLVASFGYFFVAEATTGRTLGKLVTGARVVAASGEPATPGAVLARSLVRFIPGDVISLLWRSDTAWHDAWTNTRVVSTRPRY